LISKEIAVMIKDKPSKIEEIKQIVEEKKEEITEWTMQNKIIAGVLILVLIAIICAFVILMVKYNKKIPKTNILYT